MRAFTLLLAFCAAAYLMWSLASPTPDGSAPIAATPAVAPHADLRVVLYDPGREPRAVDVTTGPYLAGWTSAEGDVVRSTADASTARGSAVFEVVGLGRPGATGACAVLRGRELRCIALFDPEDETPRGILP